MNRNLKMPKSAANEAVQTRLPFKVLDIKTALQQKKRKLQESESSNVKKVSKTEEEENFDMKLVTSPNDKTNNLKTLTQNELSESELGNKVITVEEKSTESNVVLIANELKENDEELEQNLQNVSYKTPVSSSSPEQRDQCSYGVSEDEISNSEMSAKDVSNLDSSLNTTKTDQSEMDAAAIFNAGSTCSTPVPKQRVKKVAPVSAKKKEEMEKRKEEKLKMRAEKEKQLQEERERKRKEKEEARLLKEKLRVEEKKRKQEELDEKMRIKQEKKEKEEQERQEKLKLKEEEKQKKMELLSAKMDEKKRKEEERVKKLEEKKRADEEEERKKNKVKQVFANFFIKNEQQELANLSDDAPGIFRPFEVMKGMTVASVVPDVASIHFNRDSLEVQMLNQNCEELYLLELKNKKHIPLRKTKKSLSIKDDDIVVLESSCEALVTRKAKLLKFTENIRPPYFGTWRKKSAVIKPKRPFALDNALFDYEVDSDEEWDEGGPGESLSGTEDEKESEDDYEVDNAFFVPHGYLSADEEKDEDKFDSPEEQQARLKMREIEFQEERKKRCYELKPRIIGCFWIEDQLKNPELLHPLMTYRAIALVNLPIQVNKFISNQDQVNEDKSPNEGKVANAKKPVPAEALPFLIKLVHANTNGKNTIIKEFQEFWKKHSTNELLEKPESLSVDKEPPEKTTSLSLNGCISKRQLVLTMQSISSWIRCPQPTLNQFCWWVNEDVLKEYGCQDLSVPNSWNYVSQIETGVISNNAGTPLSSSILKFTKPSKLCSSPKRESEEREALTDDISCQKKNTNCTPSIRKYTQKRSPQLQKDIDNLTKAKPVVSNDVNTLANKSIDIETAQSASKIKIESSTPSILNFMTRKTESNRLATSFVVCNVDDKEKEEDDMAICHAGPAPRGTQSIVNFMKRKQDQPLSSPHIETDRVESTAKENLICSPLPLSESNLKTKNDNTPSILNFIKRSRNDGISNNKKIKLESLVNQSGPGKPSLPSVIEIE